MICPKPYENYLSGAIRVQGPNLAEACLLQTGTQPEAESSKGLGIVDVCLKDFKFVPLNFVPLSFGSQILLLRAIFHNVGTQNPRVQT